MPDQAPICKFLRTKMMYVATDPAEAFADKEGTEASPTHYWCNLTQTVVGPDDQAVHLHVCDPSRRCFKE